MSSEDRSGSVCVGLKAAAGLRLDLAAGVSLRSPFLTCSDVEGSLGRSVGPWMGGCFWLSRAFVCLLLFSGVNKEMAHFGERVTSQARWIGLGI